MISWVASRLINSLNGQVHEESLEPEGEEKAIGTCPVSLGGGRPNWLISGTFFPIDLIWLFISGCSLNNTDLAIRAS